MTAKISQASTNSKPSREVPPLPHERDEATGSVAKQPDPVIQQARRDIDNGLVDTDMRATPGLDAERRAKLVPTPMPNNQAPAAKPQRARQRKPSRAATD